MYRIKARKLTDDDWVPIIVKPEPERRHHAAPEEPAAAGRGPIPDYDAAAHLSEPQDGLLPRGPLQDRGAAYVQHAALAAPPLDQLDDPQPHGAGAGARSVRHVLLLDAVCGVYGSARHGGAAGVDRADVHARGDVLPQPAALVHGSDPADAARSGDRHAGAADPAGDAQGGVRAVDADLPGGAAGVELCAARLLVLAL
ncbi:hypothetical protein Golomagni_06594 [Golovinomyces magnicellulatus]|nr:hypothetical protein Golomagni_06594 [Golovinomyces magnicellulatus]